MFSKYIKDPKLLADVDQCFLRSKKLYIEMLKTGLGYLSQYAVLMGMAGRWMVSGNLAGVLETVSNTAVLNYGSTASAIAQDMITDLKMNKVAAAFFNAQYAGNKSEKE
jgi:hypothetical protein